MGRKESNQTNKQRRGLMAYLKENYKFLRFQGGPTLSRGEGGQLLPGGGVQLLISMETYRTCDFPGGPVYCKTEAPSDISIKHEPALLEG